MVILICSLVALAVGFVVGLMYAKSVKKVLSDKVDA
jgi:hypothetical protein